MGKYTKIDRFFLGGGGGFLYIFVLRLLSEGIGVAAKCKQAGRMRTAVTEMQPMFLLT